MDERRGFGRKRTDRMRWAVACVLAVAATAAHAVRPRVTEVCGSGEHAMLRVAVASPAVAARIIAAAATPGNDADLYARLWTPVSAQAAGAGVLLMYHHANDIVQIHRDMQSDGTLRAIGIERVEAPSLPAGGVSLPQAVAEYRNRTTGAGWYYDAPAFHAWPPQPDGTCPASAPVPVYRAYNGRWREGDSNHRYSVRPEVHRAMVEERGWIDEGVGFCIGETDDR